MTVLPGITALAGGLEQIDVDDRAQVLALVCPPVVDPPPRRRRRSGQPPAQVRRWAIAAGVPCPWSGPISRTVRAAYDAAHLDERTETPP